MEAQKSGIIVGISGPICSGRETLANYLVNTYKHHYNFKAINLKDKFIERLLTQHDRDKADSS